MKLSFFLLHVAFSLSFANLSLINYTISRRGGSFPAPDTANLTYLLEQLQIVESRFHQTTRSFLENKVVRKPGHFQGTQGSTVLLGEVGRGGNWFADLQIGEPVQQVDMDLDMLTVDWHIISTSSRIGSFYLDFNSKTYGLETFQVSNDILIHPSGLRKTLAVSYLSRTHGCHPFAHDRAINTNIICALQTSETVDASSAAIRSILRPCTFSIIEPDKIALFSISTSR